MTRQEIQELLKAQREFYKSGKTIPVQFRIEALKKLYSAIKAHTTQINDALTKDLGKNAYEGFMCESGLVLTELWKAPQTIR